MLSLKFLNSKQAKQIMHLINDQWGADFELELSFLINSKNRLFAISRDIGKLDFSKLRINSIGLYFGELSDDKIRLTIEGSQIVGPHAKKNIADVSEEQMRSWLKGEDLHMETNCKGFVILKHNNDFLGCGRYSNGTIKNFVPKTRRIRD